MFFQSRQPFRRGLEAEAITGLCPLFQAANYVFLLVEIDAHTFDHPFLLVKYSGSVNIAGTLCPSLSLDAGLVLNDTPISLIGPLQGRQAIKLTGQIILPNGLCTSPEPVRLYFSLSRKNLQPGSNIQEVLLPC